MKDKERIEEEVEALKKCLQGDEESVFSKLSQQTRSMIEARIEVLEWVLD